MSRINGVIEVKDYNPMLHGKNTVIGVLDIYGFEIFDNNRSGRPLSLSCVTGKKRVIVDCVAQVFVPLLF